MCPNFVSDSGKWHPAKESVSMVNDFGKTLESEFIVGPDGTHKVKPGETFLYNGPDREAVKMLKQEGVDYFGKDFRSNPEFLQSIRNMGFNTVEDYLKMIGYDEKSAKEEFNKKASVINRHENPQRHKEALMLAGGREISKGSTGVNDVVGGFGPQRYRTVKEAKEEGAVVKKG